MQIQHKINSNASSCYSAIIYKYVHWRRVAKTTWKINQITFFRMKKEKKGVRMRAKERAILLLKSLVHKWLIIRCGRCCCCFLSLDLWKARAAVDMIYGMLHSMYTRNFFSSNFIKGSVLSHLWSVNIAIKIEFETSRGRSLLRLTSSPMLWAVTHPEP